MNYTEQELREAKRQIDSMLHKLRQTIKTFEAKENVHRYQSQITLAKRRTAAFEIASCLIEGELGRLSAPGRTVIIRKERKEDYAKIYSVVAGVSAGRVQGWDRAGSDQRPERWGCLYPGLISGG